MVQVIPDITLLYQMVIFLSLIFILNFLLYKPILSIIDRRKKQLEEYKKKRKAELKKEIKEIDNLF